MKEEQMRQEVIQTTQRQSLDGSIMKKEEVDSATSLKHQEDREDARISESEASQESPALER